MEITPANVANLRAQWIFHLRDTTGLEVTPVAVNGILFVTSANDAFALDARTGRAIWHYSRPVTEGLIDDASQHHNRGVGVWHSKVFLETDNATFSASTLAPAIFSGTSPTPKATKTTAPPAPLSSSKTNHRRYLRRRRWRSWFRRRVRRRNRQAGLAYLDNSRPRRIWLRELAWRPLSSRRRHHLDARHHDPELNTIYWGTSNAAPDFDGAPRPGDDLYTACVLALDPDTGKMKWYFQFTPHDLYDYDATETPVLIDAVFTGQPRKLLVQRIATDFSMFSIARMESFFPPFRLSPT